MTHTHLQRAQHAPALQEHVRPLHLWGRQHTGEQVCFSYFSCCCSATLSSAAAGLEGGPGFGMLGVLEMQGALRARS